MTVDSTIANQVVREEIENCKDLRDPIFFGISEVDEKLQLFTVRMKSKIDNEYFILEVKYDNYNEMPLYLEFIDPITEEKCTKNSYPLCNDSFFHEHPCICNPCSRNAYQGYSDIHKDWNLLGWKQNPNINSLTNLRAILIAIYSRINNKELYKGRMK